MRFKRSAVSATPLLLRRRHLCNDNNNNAAIHVSDSIPHPKLLSLCKTAIQDALPDGGNNGPSSSSNDDKTATLTDFESTMHSLARDIMNEFAMDKDSADAPSNRTAAPSDFLYRKARLIAMSCRHAFPPSKCPAGKLDDIAFQQQSFGPHPSRFKNRHFRH
mmetsp:Transcript_6451/g.12756  ORF Transcript_6451/g.12756 Transcript_6451/m.12756 type:complete len:162 (-) Transcript_6451:264-749(-)